jgi:RimJ/RimL family protein N-acetyltransferase
MAPIRLAEQRFLREIRFRVTDLETDRLRLRRLSLDDAAFILELVNEPSWLQFIGDKGVRDLDDARGYLQKGALGLYARHGFGPLAVELKSGGGPIGICGLIKRDGFDDVDIGFAFLPRHWGRGYAFESASAVLAHGRSAFGLARIVALTAPDNQSSIKLVERLGMKFERLVRLVPHGPESKLFSQSA